MKKLLNTLYVTTPGIYLYQDGETVVASLERKDIQRLPIHNLAGIVCFGQVSCSPPLLGFCAERGVHVSFLGMYGNFLARVTGGVSGNVLLRKAHFKAEENADIKGAIAQSFILGKLTNSRTVLCRALRDHGKSDDLERAIDDLAASIDRVQRTTDVDALRGIEGDAARTYFSAFNHMIVAQQETFVMKERTRRPPLDPLNALLSFLYTLLVHDCEAALEGIGLDPQVGFLHALRPGRPSLALDLMEEFRAVLADRVALSLINRKQITAAGFETSALGAVVMDDKTRKTVLQEWQTKKKETLTHPFLGEKVEVGLLPHVQALLLARHLRGDLDKYPPYIQK